MIIALARLTRSAQALFNKIELVLSEAVGRVEVQNSAYSYVMNIKNPLNKRIFN